MENTDKRVKLIGDVIASVKAIKMYNWEDLFQQSVTKVSDLSFYAIQKFMFCRCVTFNFALTSLHTPVQISADKGTRDEVYWAVRSLLSQQHCHPTGCTHPRSAGSRGGAENHKCRDIHRKG